MPAKSRINGLKRSQSADGSKAPPRETGAKGVLPGKYSIRPVKTADDPGDPGISVVDDLRRVLDLIDDERHLVAHSLYEDIKARMEEMETKLGGQHHHHAKKAKPKAKRGFLSSSTGGKAKHAKGTTDNEEQEFKNAQEIISKHKDILDLLDKRAPLFLKTKLDMDESENWTLAQTIFGITTYYRREEDESLSIKLEGELKGIPLFEQVAVLREIDLHSSWAPFVTSSLTLAQFDKLDTVGWIMVGLPNFGLARDGCFRVIGCDCTKEDNSVLIYGQGVHDLPEGVPPEKGTEFLVEDPLLENIDFPPIPTRIGSGRMTMRNFEARLTVLSPDHVRTYVLANVNPNLAFIPQSLLEFVMKKMCGFLLNKLQSAAKKTVKNPVRNIHAQRMRDDAAFYRDWLLPKFEVTARDRGWELPTISAFELTESQQMEAARLKERRASKMHSFSHYEAAKTRADSDGDVSVRSAPGLFRRTSRADSGSEDQEDNLSEISSLSGTSSSIWKNNPIATYLRDLEMKTQERKKQAVLESRQKAATRLQPRPLPQDKVQRLKELKIHKARRSRSRSGSYDGSFGSFGSSGVLSPVDEHESSSDRSDRSEPYSPISAALRERGRWTRLLVVSVLVFILSVLLNIDEKVPSFLLPGDSYSTMFFRDAVAFLYFCLCGVVHFLLCDVELIYAFEAFELGMKSGEQAKTFYRGQVRTLVAIGSGSLVGIGVTKAVVLAWVRTFIVLALRSYNSIGSSVGNDSTPAESVAEGVASAIEDSDAIKNAASDLSADEMKSLGASLPGIIFSAFSAIFRLIYAAFDWQMEIFVRSHAIGRSIENVSTGIYGLWLGFLGGLARRGGSFFDSMTRYDSVDESLASWREDALSTLRGLLLYTAVILLTILALLDVVAKSYRYKPRPETKEMEGDVPQPRPSNAGGNMTPLTLPPKSSVSSSASVDSGAKRRLRFLKKRKESLEEREDSD